MNTEMSKKNNKSPQQLLDILIEVYHTETEVEGRESLLTEICRYAALKGLTRGHLLDLTELDYYNNCIKELEEMKTIYLDVGVSSYDYMMASRNKLIGYSKNKKLCDTFIRLLADGKFKIYGIKLRGSFLIGSRYSQLYEKVSFVDPVTKCKLPNKIRDNILKYVNEYDINNFCRATRNTVNP